MPRRPHSHLDCSPALRRPVAGGRHARGIARQVALLAVLIAFLCDFAHPQERAFDRLVVADAVRLLQHRDPVVRGEAALIAGAAHHPDATATLLKLPDDPNPSARHRALLALGFVATPAAVQRLDDELCSTSARESASGAAAGYALGLLPAAAAQATQARLFNAIVQGSWRRQRDTLLAVLLGMLKEGSPRDTAPLRRLFDDESNRDPEVRAMLLRLLLADPRGRGGLDQARLLERGSDAERHELLRHLATTDEAPPGTMRDCLAKLAERSADAALRGAALQVLGRWRFPEAVELATAALPSHDATEAATALRLLCLASGSASLSTLEARVRFEQKPKTKAALLAAFQAPMTSELRDHCADLASSSETSAELRCAGALALVRTDADRADVLLRNLFRSEAGAARLSALAHAIVARDATVELDLLLPAGTDLALDAPRWLALLRAGHPEAERQVLENLQARHGNLERLRTALRVWRRARVLDEPLARPAAIPSQLTQLLE